MQIWDVFDEYQNIMNEKLQRDVETAMYECRKILENKKLIGQYTSIIVDEGQDLRHSSNGSVTIVLSFTILQKRECLGFSPCT